jgi:signal transduction histidine kinase
MGDKLAEVDRMKQDFVSNVTHELRSPLTSLRGYTDLLLKGTAGELNTLQKDYVSVVKNNSVRLGRFIDNLLDVAKIEAHKLKLAPEPTDVFEIAHEMEVLFKPQLDEKKIKFLNGVPRSMGKAYVDKDKFAEVLINLTSNAIKFTPENGHIRIAAQERGDMILVGVEDSGVGIPANMKDKVFNKFEQVKRTEGLARSQKGTGLGLTIVKGIIEAGGGKIWVESPGSSGKGTTFFFTVPKWRKDLEKND